MNKVFTEDAWKDYLYWQTQDRKTLKRIKELIRDIERDPFSGLGKPEPLKFGLSGCWSRRIDQANRLVYLINENGINILSCKDHY